MIRADRFLNRPLALLSGEQGKITRAIEAREERQVPLAAAEGLVLDIDAGGSAHLPYTLLNGIAIVSIGGVLVHEEDIFSYWFGEMGYDRIRGSFTQALASSEVKAIALHVNSPGGDVAGCFDLADTIYQARGEKPICAILDECAYSAAYALASAADVICVPRTGGTGSIGVVMMHLDVTKALDDIGFKITTFQYGARKTDSYPTTPLSDEARDRFQAEVNSLGEMFVDLVARNRGISKEAVRKMEAATFLGAEGVDQKLADAVMSPQEAFAALVKEIA